ncbi:MAG: FAD-dependent oxidoreductase [Kiritimatiellia bacterium]
MFAIQAKVFIDGTGDADLAVLAGAPFIKGDAHGRMMPGTLCSLWAGINWRTVRRSGLGRGNAFMEQAFKDGVFTIKDRHLPGMWRVGETLGGGNLGHAFNLDGTDEESLTRAYVTGRKLLPEYEAYYKRYFKGYEKMELAATGSLMGVRETRRIVADYELKLDDFKRRAVFDDEIGRYAHPVDIHVSGPDKKSYDSFRKRFKTLRLGRGESYGIPYRILIPQGISNLLVAGRCVGTDRYVQASLRVMPGCYITGQAAGVAAAMSMLRRNDVRAIDVRQLQDRLKTMGAYLPNAAV